jgi:general secretion pathway protein E
MAVDGALQTLIHNEAAESEILAAARANGLRSMREDGQRLIDDGTTSAEEVLRVTRD